MNVIWMVSSNSSNITQCSNSTNLLAGAINDVNNTLLGTQHSLDIAIMVFCWMFIGWVLTR